MALQKIRASQTQNSTAGWLDGWMDKWKLGKSLYQIKHSNMYAAEEEEEEEVAELS